MLFYWVNKTFLLWLAIGFFTLNEENINPDQEDWISLFNGKNLDGWTIKIANRPLDENHLNTFRVENQTLRIAYDQYESFDDKSGHLYYKQPYSHYKLCFDYRFLGEQTPGGEGWNVRNSGVMFHSQSAESNTFEQHFPVSIEIQLLGGLGKGNRTTANICTPGTAVVLNEEVDFRHCISSNSKTYHGDQWVRVEAIVLGSEYIAHIVEQDTVMVYKKPQIGGAFISKSRNGEDWESMGVTNKEKWIAQEGTILSEGYIALQAESHSIDFKNIELLNLCGCTYPKATNYKSYYVKNDPKKCKFDQ